MHLLDKTCTAYVFDFQADSYIFVICSNSVEQSRFWCQAVFLSRWILSRWPFSIHKHKKKLSFVAIFVHFLHPTTLYLLLKQQDEWRKCLKWWTEDKIWAVNETKKIILTFNYFEKKNIWKKNTFLFCVRVCGHPLGPPSLSRFDRKNGKLRVEATSFFLSFFLVCSLFSILFCQSGSLPSERLPAMFHPSSISFHFSFVFRFSFEAFSASSKCLSFFLLHNRGTFLFAESKVRIWFFFSFDSFPFEIEIKTQRHNSEQSEF